jgi:hypothetical protein
MAAVKAFLSGLKAHWALTLVMVVLVVMFAATIMKYLVKVPVLGPWIAARAA